MCDYLHFKKKVLASNTVKHPLNALFIRIYAYFYPLHLMVIKGVDFQKKRGFSRLFLPVKGRILHQIVLPSVHPTVLPTKKMRTKCTRTPHLFLTRSDPFRPFQTLPYLTPR